MEKNVATNLKKLGITDKNIKFDPKDKARDSTGPTSATLKVDQTKKILRPLTAKVVSTSETKNGSKIPEEKKYSEAETAGK